jgi:hypothetical protein
MAIFKAIIVEECSAQLQLMVPEETLFATSV